MTDACPTAGTLSRFAAGDLPDDSLAALGEHLDACARCRAAVDASPAPFGSAALPPAPDPLHAEPGARRAAELVLRIPGPAETRGPDHTDLAAPVAAPARFGRFRVVGVLGGGAMGVVYEADDEALGRRVAVKALRPAAAARPGARARFLREARAMAAVRHPNVVEILEVGDADAGPYLVMERLTGESLGARLRRDSRLSVAAAVGIGRAVAAGLAAAHARGLIHRDVTPENIWLMPDGTAKLIDFGLVRAAGDAAVTHPGTVVGTPRYMSPEQARAGTVDARADVFGLGAVLYHAVTGTPPFPGDDTLTVLAALATHTPAPADRVNPAVPRPLAALLALMLAKDPAARPPSAAAVIAALDAAPPRRRRGWLAAPVLLIAAAAVWFAVPPSPPAPPAADPPPAPPAEVADYGLAFAPGVSAEVPGLEFSDREQITLEFFTLVGGPDLTVPAHVFGVPRQASVFADPGGRLWGFGLRVGGGFHSFKTPPPPRGRWCHVAAVRERRPVANNFISVVRVYLDGRLVNGQEVPRGAFDPGDSGVVVGPGVGAALDEIRVSAVARYLADFTPARRFEPDPETLALYHCDEPDNPTLTDASGHGRHGTFRGGRTAGRSAPR